MLRIFPTAAAKIRFRLQASSFCRNPMTKRFLLVALLSLVAIPAVACNIPVFRYALERWTSDRLKVTVFAEGRVSNEDLDLWKQLDSRSDEDKSSNIETEWVHLIENQNPERREAWERLKKLHPEVKTPYVMIEGKHARGPFVAWHGPLQDSKSALQSPIRIELGKRLTSGDAIVWLVLQSTKDEAANKRVEQMLQAETEKLSQSLELPEGIGLPGSELFSEVPLLLKFSSLKFSRGDVKEGYLLQMLAGLQPEAFEKDEPLVVPIFGRGRALEVIPASQFTPALLRDLTGFLCAACSCQVKEQNPGFDLLLDTDWDKELFGDDGERPPTSTADGLKQQKRVLLTIPPGK